MNIRKAIFLDRDGVITNPVFDKIRKVERAPHILSEVELYPSTIGSLRKLTDMNYSLFIVTNQPDAVKGWVDINSLIDIKNYIIKKFKSNKINLVDNYYCFHHPSVAPCQCRKPSPYFLLQAKKTYDIDLSESWMIGDRYTDVECGGRAGTKTILIGEKNEISDFYAKDLKEAVEIIEFYNNIERKK